MFSCALDAPQLPQKKFSQQEALVTEYDDGSEDDDATLESQRLPRCDVSLWNQLPCRTESTDARTIEPHRRIILWLARSS